MSKNPPKTRLNPKQQVLAIYNKTLNDLEAELEILDTQKLEAVKAKVLPKELHKIEEQIIATKIDITKKKRAYKISAAKLESQNRHQLIFVQSDQGWHKLTQYSACFFTTDIQPRLKNPSRFHLNPDTDKYAYSKYGVISKLKSV